MEVKGRISLKIENDYSNENGIRDQLILLI